MTLKELSQLYHLTQEIEDYKKEQYEIINSRATNTSANLSGTVSGGNSLSREQVYVEAEERILKRLQSLEIRCTEEKEKLIEYINSIDDSITREVFFHRFYKLKSWKQVANSIYGNPSEDVVKKICYNYLKTHK